MTLTTTCLYAKGLSGNISSIFGLNAIIIPVHQLFSSHVVYENIVYYIAIIRSIQYQSKQLYKTKLLTATFYRLYHYTKMYHNLKLINTLPVSMIFAVLYERCSSTFVHFYAYVPVGRGGCVVQLLSLSSPSHCDLNVRVFLGLCCNCHIRSYISRLGKSFCRRCSKQIGSMRSKQSVYYNYISCYVADGTDNITINKPFAR